MLLWAASIMMIVLAAVGTRVAFALPLDLRANWIFRVIGVRGGLESLAASRRALLLLSVAPVWLGDGGGVLAGFGPAGRTRRTWWFLDSLAWSLADICLLRFQKIPFTCSYLPGKSRFHMVFLGAFVVLWLGSEAAVLERHALRHSSSMAIMLALLAVVWIAVRWTAVALAKGEEQELLFEEQAPPALQGLGLDGHQVPAAGAG